MEHEFKVGDRVRVKPDAPRLYTTAQGLEGTVEGNGKYAEYYWVRFTCSDRRYLNYIHLEPARAERKPLTWTEIFERWSEEKNVLHWTEKEICFEIKNFYANKDGHFFWWDGGLAKKSEIDSGKVKIYAEPPEPKESLCIACANARHNAMCGVVCAAFDAELSTMRETRACAHYSKKDTRKKVAPEDAYVTNKFAMNNTPECWWGHANKIMAPDGRINIMHAIGYAYQITQMEPFIKWLIKHDLIDTSGNITGYCAE